MGYNSTIDRISARKLQRNEIIRQTFSYSGLNNKQKLTVHSYFLSSMYKMESDAMPGCDKQRLHLTFTLMKKAMILTLVLAVTLMVACSKKEQTRTTSQTSGTLVCFQ
jgi:hypothetical protein